MIEISITDVLLFAWAAIATAYAFKYKEEAFMHKFVIHKIFTDAKVKEDLQKSFDDNFKNVKP